MSCQASFRLANFNAFRAGKRFFAFNFCLLGLRETLRLLRQFPYLSETSRLKASYSLSFELKIDSTTESSSPILTNSISYRLSLGNSKFSSNQPLYGSPCRVFSLLSQDIFWNNKIVSNLTRMFFTKRSQHDTAYWSRVRVKSSSRHIYLRSL